MTKHKKIVYQGQLPLLPKARIVLNVNHLNPGDYVLNITLSDKIIKTISFSIEHHNPATRSK